MASMTDTGAEWWQPPREESLLGKTAPAGFVDPGADVDVVGPD